MARDTLLLSWDIIHETCAFSLFVESFWNDGKRGTSANESSFNMGPNPYNRVFEQSPLTLPMNTLTTLNMIFNHPTFTRGGWVHLEKIDASHITRL